MTSLDAAKGSGLTAELPRQKATAAAGSPAFPIESLRKSLLLPMGGFDVSQAAYTFPGIAYTSGPFIVGRVRTLGSCRSARTASDPRAALSQGGAGERGSVALDAYLGFVTWFCLLY